MRSFTRSVGVFAALLSLRFLDAAGQDPGAGAGPRTTDLAGRRDRPGLFTQRLVMPAGFCSPLHIHDQDLHGLVMHGVLRMGFPDSAGRVEVRDYPAGSFVPVPAGRRHVEGSAVETEIHLSGIGPVRTTVVDSTGARHCAPAKEGA